ncbi:MAG TPA: NAD-binding protein, partial [Candidatus Saccharimonadia bacterium]|nr:NAD-binding protein [Candidatus Saccharimonadia bacterium]
AAESGQLTLLIGGDEAKLGEARPGLEAIARDVKFFGSVGAGTKYKLILNTLQAIHLAGFGEAMRLAKAAGLDEEQVANSLAERPGGVMTEISRKSYGHQPEPITFSVQWIAKDLGYTADMAGALAHPLLDDVSKLYQAAMREGHKDADWTSINES